MSLPPTDLVRLLEGLTAKIRNAGMIQLNIDMWEQHGAQFASPEERARMAADLAEASRARERATAALEGLFPTVRAVAPAAVVAWVHAHDAFLAGYLEESVVKGESGGTGVFVATRERAEWAEVGAGTRILVNVDLFHVTSHPERYRSLFGIDQDTLAPTAAPVPGATSASLGPTDTVRVLEAMLRTFRSTSKAPTREAMAVTLAEVVATTRIVAPGAFAAWVDAHDAYLAARAARGEAGSPGVDAATRERAEWSELRAGTRSWVDEAGGDMGQDEERYRALFGIDPAPR